MRARNLKPAVFTNELLAVADPLFTLIFEGLWCLADREGRLQDKPSKIHLEINPGRAFEGTERALEWLKQNEFIDRYRVGNDTFIQVLKFLKHQNPHHKEAPSKIPCKPKASPRKARGKPGANPGQASEKPHASPADSLFSDSGFLTPDSGSLIPESGFRIPDSGSPLPGHAPAAPVRPIQGRKTILKNGSGETPQEGGTRSRDGPRPASETAMQALRAKGLA